MSDIAVFVIFATLVVFSVLFYGSCNINSGFFLKVKSKSRKFPRGVILSFDDGPDLTNTPEILDILDKNGIKAIFFVTGVKALKSSELVKRIYMKGHLIGNHSYSHSNLFPFFPKNKIISELKKTAEIIEKITGIKPLLFRPPFGVINPSIKFAVNKLGYKTVGWSVRSLDTVLKKKEKILSSVVKKVKGGDIVLFHDTVNGTVDMLNEFIVYCKSKGFEFVDPEKFLPEE